MAIPELIEAARTGESPKLERPHYVQRWNVHQRAQHFLLMVSMCTLMATGFPIKYASAPWAPTVIAFFGGFRNMLLVHKGAAVLLVLTAVYHVMYLIAYALRHGPTWAMVPRVKDIKDMVHHAGYLLGLRADPPQYDRYSYLEKFEYFAVVWGMVVMGSSGFALWFPQVAAAYVPRWGLDALRIVHSNEAFVAILSLVFGHFFMVHFKPDIFPMSTVWYNGKMPLYVMIEEHPGELQAMGVHLKHHISSRWSRSRGLIYFELGVYAAIMFVLLAVFVPQLLM